MRYISWARRFGRDSRGSIALKAALILPAVLMMGAGAFDLTQVQASKVRLQDIADSAALAAANDLSLATDGSNAKERARAYVDAQLGEWGDHAPTVAPTYEVVEIDGQRAIQVRLEGHRPSFFASLLPPGGWHFNARSTATTMGMVPLCVLVTGDTGTRVLHLQDSGRMNAPACLVHSNRDIVVDGGSITAAAAQAVTSASGFISPTAGTGAASIADPFANLDLGRQHNLLCSVADLLRPVIVNSGTHYIDPGKHCGGIWASGTARIVLRTGDHFFLGGHLIISQNARLEGQDVALFFDRASRFEFKDRALVNLDGRKSGQFAGLVVGGTRDNTQDFIISADHVEALLGVIYVPSARLVVQGSADIARDSAWTVIVAKAVKMQGSPSLFINANYDASGVPVPDGVGPRTGGSRLID
ncbi:pilus assembly protein TadG-related protein [Brevundimonas sp.]|uniref:pilus assembly protein TadG-related protein n=1 Tax=Brevundimonas sp. TaxID=1871086 RepID=UPI002D56348F|nr:pilus assembly protein TadG-related protein [Brevundimonas sp.]HYC74740.1 pilus assembly protein TadG-related protein [Brevundimonas sp.]